MTKFGLEVLTGKALSFLLEFMDETGKNALFTNASLALLYLDGLFINKPIFKTTFNNLFLQNDFTVNLTKP